MTLSLSRQTHCWITLPPKGGSATYGTSFCQQQLLFFAWQYECTSCFAQAMCFQYSHIVQEGHCKWCSSIMYTTGLVHKNPNTLKSYKISKKLSPKHALRGIGQSPYSIYRHGKACLSKQPPWRTAVDPHRARSRSRVRALAPAGALHTLFSHLPHRPRNLSVRVKGIF